MVADSITRAGLLQATGLDDGKVKLVLTFMRNCLMARMGMKHADFRKWDGQTIEKKKGDDATRLIRAIRWHFYLPLLGESYLFLKTASSRAKPQRRKATRRI